MTVIKLDKIPLAFIVSRDIFLISYKQNAEYIRVENKGKETETVTRFNLW